ncbi:S26 family signal peptidase [Streptomyces sp. NPDC001262]|uniref:S26 family signal peptidase n=1 Tax=Streptomyces sp. NPDC001262 TaxID=3364552 RepID=UPI00368C6447
MTAAPARRFLPVCGALAAAGLAVAARSVVVVTVRGESMAPAFRDGDRVLVRRGRRPSVGEVVVAERPAAGGTWPGPPVRASDGAAAVQGRVWLIKRVAAVPGDRIRFRGTGGAERVPPGRLVLLGDNRAVSHDSRHLGYFPADRVLGRVLRWRSLAS